MTQYAQALAVCQTLHDAGLWISLHEGDVLRVGPTPVARQHPELLAQVRAHKADLLAILRETLAYQVLGDAPGYFETETCSECQQPSFVVTAPRRVAVHRTLDGSAVCPGAIRAQEAMAQTLMTRFIAERCVQRPGAALTWMALRGAVEGWAREQGWLLPPRPYLIAWMDAHYKRLSTDDVYASWQGLTFTLEEWFGEDEPTASVATTARGQQRKAVLKA